MNDIKQVLETVFQNLEKDHGLSITNVSQRCNNSGDNFMSDASTVTVSGTLTSGTLYSGGVFVKRPVENQARRALTHMEEAFNNEALMYLKVFPLIPGISEIVPECLFASKDIIVMNNLFDCGFKMLDKRKGLDLLGAKLVMKAIARFHAGSYNIRISKGEEIMNKLMFESFNFISDTTLLSSFIQASIKSGIKNLMMAEDEKLNPIILKLEDIHKSGELNNILEKLHRSKSLSVICHGDLWVNNILFHYGCNNIVDRVKLVDFQLVRKCSLAIDLWTFLYSSISPEILNSNYDYLMSLYYSAFTEGLRVLELPEHKIPTKGEIQTEMESREFYGFLMSLFLLPGMTKDFEESSVDIDKSLQDLQTALETFSVVNCTLSERLVKLAKRCLARGVFSFKDAQDLPKYQKSVETLGLQNIFSNHVCITDEGNMVAENVLMNKTIFL